MATHTPPCTSLLSCGKKPPTLYPLSLPEAPRILLPALPIDALCTFLRTNGNKPALHIVPSVCLQLSALPLAPVTSSCPWTLRALTWLAESEPVRGFNGG